MLLFQVSSDGNAKYRIGIRHNKADQTKAPPADGTVTVTMDGSNHAIGLELTGGLEVLIHIGVDTVNLNGEGFKALAKTGDTVKAGDELIRFEREALEAKGYCMEIMQIVMEGEHSGDVQYTTGVTAKAGETIVGIWQ